MWADTLEGKTTTHYYDLGPSMIDVFEERGEQIPELNSDCLRVMQCVDVINDIDYIGDGSMDLLLQKIGTMALRSPSKCKHNNRSILNL